MATQYPAISLKRMVSLPFHLQRSDNTSNKKRTATMINKLKLRAFYESRKDHYYERRNSGDNSQWDERYKWDIFPKLNEILSEYKDVTADNLPEIMNILKKHNPQQGSFAHWI